MAVIGEESEIRKPLTVLAGDARQTLPTLEAGSIHMAVTSPPYWALRSYLPKDHLLKHLELGSEPTPEKYVENLVGVFGEVKRVLRDDGVCFVNLGDTYSQGNNGAACGEDAKQSARRFGVRPNENGGCGMEAGSRILIPERFALAMQLNGWLLRDVIIWHKLSPMPSSVDGWRWARHRVKLARARQTRAKGAAALEIGAHSGSNNSDMAATWRDCAGCPKCSPTDGLILSRGSWRTTCAHETIFMFAKRMNYFCDAEAVAEEAASTTVERNQYSRVNDDRDEQFAVRHDHEFVGLTRNPRSVRNFKASFYSGKHYAAFPISIPEWCIRAGTSSKGVCAECGAPWARIVKSSTSFHSGSGAAGNTPIGKNADNAQALSGDYDIRKGPVNQTSTLGWRATCACNAEIVPATVLDPFGGTGTTAQAAISLGRHAVLCELNPEYIEQIGERINGSVPLFAGGLTPDPRLSRGRNEE